MLQCTPQCFRKKNLIKSMDDVEDKKFNEKQYEELLNYLLDLEQFCTDNQQD